MKVLKQLKDFFAVIFIFLFLFSCRAWAEEIKIVFTGQSYAMLYPCACPYEPSGGVLRRASVIKKIRSETKNVVCVEAGSSFGSGPGDQNSQNYVLDSRRTEVYLKSLQMMGYDALLASGQEYVFGEEFLKSHQEVPFISSNIQGFPRPAVLNDLGGIKIGILGLTDASAISRGAQGWQAPLAALKERVAELKKKGASLIILLSSLQPTEDKELLKGIKGVDIVINGSPSYGSVELNEEDGIIYLSTWWQAKKVGVLSLEVSGNKIAKKKLEAVALNTDIADDETLVSSVPSCFRVSDCRRIGGMNAQCENAATPQARCIYTSLPKINVTIIKPRVCRTCRTEEVIKALQNVFGRDLATKDIFEDEATAQALMKEFKITMLPAYILDKKEGQAETFSSMSTSLEKGDHGYLLKPAVAGVSYFVKRPEIPKRLDVFFDFSYPALPALFKLLKTFGEEHKDIDIRFHFLVLQDKDGTFISKGGASEIEEFKRVACIAELYPAGLLDYLICRSAQKEPSWWDECARQAGIDSSKVKGCVFSDQGKQAFLKQVRLTQELQVAVGPTFVIDNKEVFGVVNVPSIEEFQNVVLGNVSQRKEDKKTNNQ